MSASDSGSPSGEQSTVCRHIRHVFCSRLSAEAHEAEAHLGVRVRVRARVRVRVRVKVKVKAKVRVRDRVRYRVFEKRILWKC